MRSRDMGRAGAAASKAFLLLSLLAVVCCSGCLPKYTRSLSAQNSVLVVDTASGVDSVQELLARAVFVRRVIGRSSAQIGYFREYYNLSLRNAKQKALRDSANVLQVTYYHNFRLIPFGARLHARMYRMDSASYGQLATRLQDAEQNRLPASDSSCVLHLKTYYLLRVDLYVNGSLLVADYHNSQHQLGSMKQHNREQIFHFKQGSTLALLVEGLSYKHERIRFQRSEELFLSPGREHYIILAPTYVPTTKVLYYGRHSHRVYREDHFFREPGRTVFERDY